MRPKLLRQVVVAVGTLAACAASGACGADGTDAAGAGPGQWTQLGGSSSRNNTPETDRLPVEWNVGEFDLRTGRWLGRGHENIRWVAKLGDSSYGSPVVAGGKVFCATNNGAAYLDRYPASVDLGCLLAFRQADGRFLWQHSAEKLKAGSSLDYENVGMCSTPLVEADRLWAVTNRAEVVCLDTEGFRDGQNDGPFFAEPSQAADESDVIWSFDMMGRLGVVPRYMCNCSVTAAGDLLLVCTSNGVDSSGDRVPAPEAPSFIALNKHTGGLVWADSSPDGNILNGQWASPAFAVLGGVPQAIFPGGDGWLYSFLAEPAGDGKPRLLWKFDCNPKRSEWDLGDRNNLIATPVIHGGRIYIATGRDPEEGDGQGDLWCIDPTKTGDVSAELVVDRFGNAALPRRTRAVDDEAGETVRPNPNSAAVWHYRGHDADGDGRRRFEETMHRALGTVAVRDDLLVIGDYAGLVHCLDANTGRLHWTYDALAAIWGSPLIADGKIYLGDEDGDVAVLELAPKLNLLAENNVGDSVYSTPVAVRNVLYISTRSHLVAIWAAHSCGPTGLEAEVSDLSTR